MAGERMGGGTLREEECEELGVEECELEAKETGGGASEGRTGGGKEGEVGELVALLELLPPLEIRRSWDWVFLSFLLKSQVGPVGVVDEGEGC